MSKITEEFSDTVNSLFKGMDSYLSTKTVVGEPIHIGDTIILPLINVSFGVGAGVLSNDKSNNGAGGMGGKMSPGAVLIISEGSTRLINVATHTGMDKLLDMVPDFVEQFSGKKKEKAEAKVKAAEKMTEIIEEAINE